MRLMVNPDPVASVSPPAAFKKMASRASMRRCGSVRSIRFAAIASP